MESKPNPASPPSKRWFIITDKNKKEFENCSPILEEAELPALFHISRGIVMSHCEFELEDMQEFLSARPFGHIVIGGLGLGLVIDKLVDFPTVETITVIEIDQEIIDLVSDKYKDNPKVTVILGDVRNFDGKQLKNVPDYVYLDIWDTDSAKEYEDRVETLVHWRKYCSQCFVWAMKRSEDRYFKEKK